MKWIKTDEELPAEYEWVLVVLNGKTTLGRRIDGKSFQTGMKCENCEWWMALPKPPME